MAITTLPPGFGGVHSAANTNRPSPMGGKRFEYQTDPVGTEKNIEGLRAKNLFSNSPEAKAVVGGHQAFPLGVAAMTGGAQGRTGPNNIEYRNVTPEDMEQFKRWVYANRRTGKSRFQQIMETARIAALALPVVGPALGFGAAAAGASGATGAVGAAGAAGAAGTGSSVLSTLGKIGGTILSNELQDVGGASPAISQFRTPSVSSPVSPVASQSSLAAPPAVETASPAAPAISGFTASAPNNRVSESGFPAATVRRRRNDFA